MHEVAVCGVVPVAAVMPVFPSIVHIPALYRKRYRITRKTTPLRTDYQSRFFPGHETKMAAWERHHLVEIFP